MTELRGKSEVVEARKPEVPAFKEIKPQSDMTLAEAKLFVESLFQKMQDAFNGYYTSYSDRIKHVPAECSDRGSWEGNPGESKFIPSAETDAGRMAKEALEKIGMDGIEYKNAEPDFSKCAVATVQIDSMTENREKNFDQADNKCAEQWNAIAKDGRADWTGVQVRDWRRDEKNNCSWHECCDTKTMHLVPREIHGYFTHSGGVAECLARDGKNTGGGFDE